MGLLTDPANEENKKKTFIVKYHSRICIFIVFSSVAWLCCLAHDNFSASKYPKYILIYFEVAIFLFVFF